jgi:hypothetical protein
MAHCGCDTTRPYNFATTPDWDANRLYENNVAVKFENVIFKSIHSQVTSNMGQRPPNPVFWNAVPFENCFDTSRCAPPAPTSPPPVEPPPMNSIEKASATGNPNPGQYIIPPPTPAPYTDTTTITAPPGTGSPYDPDEMPPPPTPMLPNLNLPKLPELPRLDEIETKHVILGMAGVLTLILLFKK